MVVAFAASIRMIPVKVLKEQPGYLLNSMLVPLLVSAEQLWANGVGDVEDIDRAWRIGTGSPKGPFQILDIIGLVTAYNVALMNPAAKILSPYRVALLPSSKRRLTRARPALLLVRASTSTSKGRTGYERFQPGIHFVWMPGFLVRKRCIVDGVSRQAAGALCTSAAGV